MNKFNFFQKLYWIFFGHLLVPLWWSRDKRRYYRSQIIYRIIERHCKPYLSAVNLLEDKDVIKDKGEKVYSFWGWNPMPDLVKSCFGSMKENLKQDIVILDEKTIFDYIDLPDFIMERRARGEIGDAHFSDIMRVELLFTHGGFWLDSTALVSGAIPQNIIDTDFFMYLWQKPSDFSYGFVQNCFIHGRKGSYLLEAWRAIIHEYWKNEDGAYDYFIHQILFKILVNNDMRAKKCFAKMPHIDQGITHKLWNYNNKPFDKKLFDKITSKVFFQKTRYADTKNVMPGSFSDAIIKGQI